MAIERVSPAELVATIEQDLRLYSDEITKKIKAEAKILAKECADDIRMNAAMRGLKVTGKYIKGWTSRKAFENSLEVRYVVYNRSKPGLTHLLEHGHAGPKPAKAYPHIKEAEDIASRYFEKRIKEIVKGQ